MILATPAPTMSPSQFNTLVAAAHAELDSKDYALDLGVTQEALFRYADGAVFDEEERGFLTGMIAKNKWCMSVVVNRVKRRRLNRRSAA